MIFRNWVLQNFPFLEDDFDALTDYELFCKMVEYMKKSLDKIKDYQTEINVFSAKLDEFQHYFDNLDVQEEINNKLDEMAESGELTDIIAQYLGLAGVLAFNTVSDLADAENVVNGSICYCLGRNEYNDKYGYFYKIREITISDVIDGVNIVAINNSNNLVGELIEKYYIDSHNPIYYGADPTGTSDSSQAIQDCLDANINQEVVFSVGTYKIENPIEVSYNNVYGGIDFNNSMIINETENDYVIGIGTADHDLTQANSNNTTNRFYNISNLKMQSTSTYAILIDRWFMNVRFDNIDIITDKNGIQIGKSYDGYANKPNDVQLSNFILTNTDMTGDYEGITIIGTDNKFNDGRIYGFKTGINANNQLVQLENIHFLACNFGETNLTNDYVCVKHPNILIADMCYCDSYPCFVKATDNNGSIMVTNLFIFSWHDQFTEASIFDFSEVAENTSVIDFNYKNIRFNKSGYPNATQIIELSSVAAVNRNLINGFNSQGNIRIAGVNDLTNAYKDLSLARKGAFANNYTLSWNANWLPMGYIVANTSGYALINVVDDTVGIVTFKLRFNDSLGIQTCEKLSQTATGYSPALGFINIATGIYKVCFAKNKGNLTQTTNTQDTIEVIKNPCCYITAITNDLYNIAPTTEATVDTVSS